MIAVVLISIYFKYMPFFKKVDYEMLTTNYQCLHCEDVDFSETENGFKLEKPIGQSVNYVWSKEIVYDLTKTSAIKVDFDAYATGDLSENILFSLNRASWGENTDALSLTGWTNNGSEIWGAGVRTGMFANWLKGKDWDNPKHLVREDKWSHITVSLGQTNTCMFIEGKEIICSALSAGQVPSQGHIGFWAWSSNTGGILEVKNIKVTQLSAFDEQNQQAKEVSQSNSSNNVTLQATQETQPQQSTETSANDTAVSDPQPEKKKVEIQWSKDASGKDEKETAFLKTFKPRPECEDPNLEWEKMVQCKNEKMNAREKFYKTH